jgi:hypothetical protein
MEKEVVRNQVLILYTNPDPNLKRQADTWLQTFQKSNK